MEGSESDPGDRRPTMAEVARRAGVSRATVSFVVNDTPGQSIGMQTRRRVLDAVEALSYRPNRAAQGLRTRRSATIGFVTHDTPERSFADPAITGAHDVADEFGSRLVLVTTGGSPGRLRAALDDLVDRQVDAIIVATSGTRAIALPHARRSRPSVLVNCFEGEAGQPSVPTLPTRLTTLLPDEQAGGPGGCAPGPRCRPPRFRLSRRQGRLVGHRRTGGRLRQSLDGGGRRPASPGARSR